MTSFILAVLLSAVYPVADRPHETQTVESTEVLNSRTFSCWMAPEEYAQWVRAGEPTTPCPPKTK
jgi:hypothetical protein